MISLLQLSKRLYITAPKTGWSLPGGGWVRWKSETHSPPPPPPPHLRTDISIFPSHVQPTRLPAQTDTETANLLFCVRNAARASVPCTPGSLSWAASSQKGSPHPPAPPLQDTLLLCCFCNLSPCELLPNRSRN